MIGSTSDRRKAILDGTLLPRFGEAMDALDRAEEAREAALGALKEARSEAKSVSGDIRHVGNCRDIACSRCGALLPNEED